MDLFILKDDQWEIYLLWDNNLYFFEDESFIIDILYDSMLFDIDSRQTIGECSSQTFSRQLLVCDRLLWVKSLRNLVADNFELFQVNWDHFYTVRYSLIN